MKLLTLRRPHVDTECSKMWCGIHQFQESKQVQLGDIILDEACLIFVLRSVHLFADVLLNLKKLSDSRPFIAASWPGPVSSTSKVRCTCVPRIAVSLCSMFESPLWSKTCNVGASFQGLHRQACDTLSLGLICHSSIRDVPSLPQRHVTIECDDSLDQDQVETPKRLV